MDPLGLIAVAFLAFLCSGILRRDCLIIAQPILGLAAPPNAGLHNGRRMGFKSRSKPRSVSFGLFRNLLALADYMEDYLGKSRCTNRFGATSALLSPIGTAYQTSRSLRSQSGVTMMQSLLADATSRVASILEQIKTQVFPTGVSSGSVRLAVL